MNIKKQVHEPVVVKSGCFIVLRLRANTTKSIDIFIQMTPSITAIRKDKFNEQCVKIFINIRRLQIEKRYSRKSGNHINLHYYKNIISDAYLTEGLRCQIYDISFMFTSVICYFVLYSASYRLLNYLSINRHSIALISLKVQRQPLTSRMS